MSKPPPAKYRTTNWNEYNASLVRRGTLILWLDKDMDCFATPSGKRERCEIFSDVAIQFCLMLKNLYDLPLRQTAGMVSSILQLAHLHWPAPDYSTLCRRQKDLNVSIGYTRNSNALHLLVDSTGIKMVGKGEWKTKKYGAQYRRQWRKLHLGIDAHTLEIRAIEVTSNEIGDAPMLPERLKQIRWTKQSVQSQQMVLMIPNTVMRLSPHDKLKQSSLYARMANPGKTTLRE